MAKLFALTNIILPATKDAPETIVSKGKVFDATVDQAKQFDALRSARQATNEEIAAAKEAAAKEDGTAFLAPAPSDSVLGETDEGPSLTGTTSVSGDPKAAPKGKTA